VESYEKVTVTDTTQPRDQYEINMFGDISIVGEEDLTNWQMQTRKIHTENGKINLVKSRDTGDRITENLKEESPDGSISLKQDQVLGDGPIFIQRKTEYRIKE
jgi:hypothetical protein